MANKDEKQMHSQDVVQRMWRPALAVVLPMIYGIGVILGTEFPLPFEIAAIGTPAGLMADRALYKRRSVADQALSGDPS